MVLPGFCQKDCINGLSKEEAQMVKDIPDIKDELLIQEEAIATVNQTVTEHDEILANHSESIDTLQRNVSNLSSDIESLDEYTTQQIEKIPETASFYLYDNDDWSGLFFNNMLKTDVLVSFDFTVHYKLVGSTYYSTDVKTVEFIIPRATPIITNTIVCKPVTCEMCVSTDDSDNFHIITASIPTLNLDVDNSTFNLTIISKMFGKETETNISYGTVSSFVSYYESQTVTFQKQLTNTPVSGVNNFRLYIRGDVIE